MTKFVLLVVSLFLLSVLESRFSLFASFCRLLCLTHCEAL
ncbi:hypothetical protein HFN_1744 [Helicobacter fennelliae MRY12-0050]|uniref:Uncharacterized protein n=1 Tax=Helicobacter fennelliae MRY12-0050 TaxID=1325130 RepID=T1CYW3_9HELI|nr:hypothetical protein HFN_1744 [Helicobacter fennelliae MRY12-0050]